MKKMLLLLRQPRLLAGCARVDVYCSKQTGSSSTKGNHQSSFLRFWNWAEETVERVSKFVAAQKMLLKQKPSKHS